MIYVYLVTVRMKFEYSNNEFGEKWSNSKGLYCYTSEKDARKDIWKMKQEESKNYSKWLRQDEKTRGLFIHHVWDVEKKDVFQTSIKD